MNRCPTCGYSSNCNQWCPRCGSWIIDDTKAVSPEIVERLKNFIDEYRTDSKVMKLLNTYGVLEAIGAGRIYDEST